MYRLYSILVLWLASTVLWGSSILLQNVTVVDLLWGVAFPFLAIYHYLNDEVRTMRGLIAIAMMTVWGLRLFLYLFYRNHVLTSKEDARYTELRKGNRTRWLWYSYVNPFMLQLGAILITALSLVSLYHFRLSFGAPAFLSHWLDWLGVVVFTAGLYLEIVSDYQLMLFKAEEKNKGKLWTQGLWRYSRHPNYFGECLVWWGIFFLAAAQGTYWTIISPLFMTLNLVKGTGVEMIEPILHRTYGKSYQRYTQETSPFVPLPVSS